MTKKAILLLNLGTPDAPTPSAVRRYLNEFLSDTRVVNLPKLLWQPILKGFILPFRPKKTAEAYQAIWQEAGSPLLVITQKQTQALQAYLADQNITVHCAMRYGNPSIESVLADMLKQGIDDIVILPLYPQFSVSTTTATLDKVYQVLASRRSLPSFRFIHHYAEHPAYISALCASIRAHWQAHGRGQLLLMSFHGLPQKNVDDGDPYQDLCYRTAHAVAQQLGLADDEFLVTFQSRFGPATWLQPYTDKTLENLPEQGIKQLDVICPGFSADCLETLEEMAMQNRDVFMDAGGESYRYIEALNDRPEHIACLAEIALESVAINTAVAVD